jgi:hypothetical protein
MMDLDLDLDLMKRKSTERHGTFLMVKSVVRRGRQHRVYWFFWRLKIYGSRHFLHHSVLHLSILT